MTEIDFNLERAGLPERIANRIEESLYGKEGGISEKLGSETDLARQFGVSRPVIREALLLLRGRGLVTQKCGSSARITVPDAALLRDSVNRLAQIHGIKADDVFSVRMALEREAIRLAAAHRTGEDIRILREISQKIADCKDGGPERADLDISFHTAIARASGNMLLPLMIEAISSVLRELIITALHNVGTADDAVAYHSRLIDEIEAGDADSAEKTIISHLTRSRQNIGPAGH